MSLQVKAGTFHLDSTLTAGNNLAITGVGFQPKLIFFFSNGRIDTSNAVGSLDQRRMFGVATGTSAGKNWVICGSSTNNISEKSGSCRRSDSCIAMRTPERVSGFPFDAVMNLASFDSNGFTLAVVVQAIANYQVSYLALGGSDITNIATGNVTTKASIGAQATTGLGFQPDFLLIANSETGEGLASGTSFGPLSGAGPDYPSSSFTSSPTGLTFANSGNSGVIMCTGDDGAPAPPTDCKNYSRTGELIVTGSSFAGTTFGNVIDIVSHLVSLDVDGFTINYTAIDSDGANARTDCYYLAIKGLQTAIGTVNTRTDSNPITVSGLPIQPAGLMLLSVCNPQSSVSGAYDTHDAPLSVGFVSGTSARNAQGSRAENNNNSGVNNDNSSIAFDKIYQNVNNAGAIQGAADLNSLNSDGFTMHMTTPDAQVNQIHFIAFGEAAVVGDHDKVHNVDMDIFDPTMRLVHNVDLLPTRPFRSFVNLNSNVIPPITDPNAFVKLNSTVLTTNRSFVLLAGTIRSANNRSFVKLNATVQSQVRSFVKLAGTVTKGNSPTHNVDMVIAQINRSFVNLAGTIVQPLTSGACGSFPNISFVKLAGWIIDPKQSHQAPGTGLLPIDDFQSSLIAQSVYHAVSQIILDGIALIITGFTVGVISYQTRTRTWLRRVDDAPSGILISTEKQVRQLATGQVITTITTTEQNQDTTIVTVQTINGNTPNLVQKTVTETTRTGKTTTREITTNTTNGIINQVQKKTITTQPPFKDNVQPIKVTTLDGVQHYQFFNAVNPEWAGGDAEGTTETDTTTQITPSSLNGQTHDQFGNPILSKVTTSTETDPTGKVIETRTEEIGTRRDVGTIVTDTESDFNGIQTTTISKTTYPDGSQDVKTTVTNNTTGDSIQTDVSVNTDIFGNVTTTTTVTETKTFVDPVTGIVRETVTRTETTQVNGVTTNEITSTVNNNFEDDIINDKIREYLIQELTITCSMDWQNMDALLEKQIQHQTQYALVELFGQQLGNAQLSFALRQRLIQQFNAATDCMIPLKLIALGKTYDVVFAPSASSFRAKYIPGTEPHVYEVQMILQERSNLINGTRQFG